MLTIKHGDLFKNVKRDAIIVHGCNAQGKMGSGFAKEVRYRYKGAYEAYMSTTKYMEVGQCTFYKHWTGVIIANAITQKFYGYDGKCYVDYPGTVTALKKAVDVAKQEKLPIHLPLIGCGLAGGDEKIMMPLLHDVFHDVDATLWLYK